MTEAADIIAVIEPILGRPMDLALEEPEAPPPDPAEPASNERKRIVGLLGPTPVALDDLVRLSGSSPTVVRTVLLELELAGGSNATAAGWYRSPSAQKHGLAKPLLAIIPMGTAPFQLIIADTEMPLGSLFTLCCDAPDQRVTGSPI